MRIVSVLPAATEILVALGVSDQIVGISFECSLPPERGVVSVVCTSALPQGLEPPDIDSAVIDKMTSGSGLYELDRDAVARLKPDLIITQDLCDVCAISSGDVAEALESLGVHATVLEISPETFDDVLDSIARVGAAVGAEEKAAELLADLKSRLRRVGSRLGPLADGERPLTFLLEWTDPPFAAGHWVPTMIERAGGRCVLGYPNQRSRQIDWDDVGAQAIDIALIAPCGFHLKGAATQALDLVAVGLLGHAKQVWALDADAHVVRPGPRLVDGIEIMAQVLHPELFGSPDPKHARLIRQ